MAIDHKLTIYTDGGARGNPGPAGIGVVVKDSANQVVYEFSGYIGETTNNEAEYQAILKSIEWVESLSPTPEHHITWCLDSQLVVEQLNKNWKIKEPRLQVWAQKCWVKLQTLKSSYSITHVRRAFNKEADALVNQALDAHQA